MRNLLTISNQLQLSTADAPSPRQHHQRISGECGLPPPPHHNCPAAARGLGQAFLSSQDSVNGDPVRSLDFYSSASDGRWHPQPLNYCLKGRSEKEETQRKAFFIPAQEILDTPDQMSRIWQKVRELNHSMEYQVFRVASRQQVNDTRTTLYGL